MGTGRAHVWGLVYIQFIYSTFLSFFPRPFGYTSVREEIFPIQILLRYKKMLLLLYLNMVLDKRC